MRKITTILLLLCLSARLMQAQIVIGGHVYGGGNAGDTGGSTTVTIREGNLNRVFGGARMADVKGRAFTNIDGANASSYIVINRLYGGNDIAGTIGTSEEELPAVVKTHAETNNVGKDWNALLLISTKTNTDGTEADDAQKIYIGQLFGGGDGEYEYGSRTEDDKTIYYAKEDGVEVATSNHELTPPELGKTFLDIHGGSIVYAYGGGNNATVTERTVISLDNPSKVVNSIKDTRITTEGDGELLTNERFEEDMGINTTFSYPSSDEFQIGRLFGGNNKADMAIRPRWNLQRGSVRNLYGGGNEGRMTSPEGLLLQIEGAGMTVDNVYGGCRKADVKPLYDGDETRPVPYDKVVLNPNPNNIPAGYAARVRVLAGHVKNVYGGNDISGNVYGGNTVGIFTHIYGDVYGGGNGSYAYTDNAQLQDDPRWGDFYYNPKDILHLSADTFTGMQSAEALNLFRPNAEKVSILVRGTKDNPVIVDGGLFVGGNSASLRENVAGSSAGDQTHIKIGSYVTVDSVFLGNNGANMIKYDGTTEFSRGEGVLRTFARTFKDSKNNDAQFSQMTLTDADVFAKYMEGCAMKVKPNVVFESKANGDADDYKEYTTKFGSFYCGGNVGSIIVPGKITVDFNDKVIIYNKVVGGCNNANVYATTEFNAEYLGGLLGDYEGYDSNGGYDQPIGDKLELNFGGLKIQPMRWKDKNDKSQGLVWNTISSATGEDVDFDPSTASTGESSATDMDRRLKGGNIYGGCYNTGHVNGNVVINIDASIIERDSIFDIVEYEEGIGEPKLYDNESYKIIKRKSGVILDEQGMDVLASALNVFGGGYGKKSEIWGSTTINLNKGYVFQVFGGGEQGAVGKKNDDGTYSYDEKYSTYINLKGLRTLPGVSRNATGDSSDMAEAEFIYGGGFEGLIAGNTHVNLGNGRIFNSFAGSCNANILGHTETYVGRNTNNDNDQGFPYIRDHIYGGNDLGGKIFGTASFAHRVSSDLLTMVYNPQNTAAGNSDDSDNSNGNTPEVLKASAYVEYIQGHVENIFGGCYGDYDYDTTYGSTLVPQKPWMENAFVNFKPNNESKNSVDRVYGAGQGFSIESYLSDIEKSSTLETAKDAMQNRSYVLINIADDNTKYTKLEVFGAGDYSGLGMGVEKESAQANENGVTAAAVIDLMRGQINNAYGASYREGVTRRTLVNVPEGSTIHLNRIFGGAFGLKNNVPCDVYESNVNYNSEQALVGNWRDGIYGGNNNARRTLYSFVNINAPVWYDKENEYTGTVFGAGYGKDSWAQYTQVNLNEGAKVYEVYGGGNAGMVLNKASVNKWDTYTYKNSNDEDVNATVYKSLGNYTDEGLDSYLVTENALATKTNTNVYINKGANVCGYMYDGSLSGAYGYGAGLGADATVSGTTYIGLHGGTVVKDIYAAGSGGSVLNLMEPATNTTFTAQTNAYIEGGTVRNVYGGGWRGSVGKHAGELSAPTDGDIPGETNVVIGIREDQDEENLPEGGMTFYKGLPTVQRNAYGGGEGGSIYGTAHLTLNNGFIGYYYDPEDGADPFKEKISDETWSDESHPKGTPNDRLEDCGNVFGAGYDDLSTCDFTHVKMYGGLVRNSLHGGGEIATVGRGATKQKTGVVRELDRIYKAGGTHVEIYNGHVRRNVFGGGKGYNVLRYGVGNGLYTDGYVFGQTEVYIHGGEIGTDEGLAKGYGNVFGGGDIGYVYSRGYEDSASRQKGTGSPGHWYYYDEGTLTEDCKVVVSPYLQVRKGQSVTYEGKTYGAYSYVPTAYLNTLPKKGSDGVWPAAWSVFYTGDRLADGTVNPDDPVERGVQIHNAVFAGGNVSSNSDQTYANATTVFGNTTAVLNDVYHRDFITVGTEHTGGLYGGGNLSMVDGYRELNITNYGTDYYGLNSQITLAEYEKMSNRERAYFKLEYQCQQAVTINGKEYKREDRIGEEDYNHLPDEYRNETYWKQFGFCSIYAGRLLNTIQRADMCGVYGSRLVLQGAKDRVADVGDATVYTINRVGELSLNKQQSITPGDTGDDAEHGNYFGIYSVVNYMGNLTSDVTFDDKYKYSVSENGKDKTVTDETRTYYDWKVENLKRKNRNIGTCHNQVALASGVFLELTTENSTATKKDYGYITGIVELDLINVKKDFVGGGYVYAKNEHGERRLVAYDNIILSPYNKAVGSTHEAARTYRYYQYGETASELHDHETSGNFIHRRKRIVDDCYPNNGVYNDGYVESPAHYWYIKGEVYVYDQNVSAYAGAAAAYSKEVKIPLTITAGSNGKLQLLNVQPNLYAYYGDFSRSEDRKISADGVKVDNESTTFYLNDVITWWDWQLLTDDEKKYFVRETYVNVDSCYVNGTLYPAGTYVLENDPTIHGGNSDGTAYHQFKAGAPSVKNVRGEVVDNIDDVFRSSNNISHNTGYVLTFDMDSPPDWDDWYSPDNGSSVAGKVTKAQYGEKGTAEQANYREGPTFRLKDDAAAGLYGQRDYVAGDIISKEIYDDYTNTTSGKTLPPAQATVADRAYVANQPVTLPSRTVLAGYPLSQTEFDGLTDAQKNVCALAKVCTSTIQLGNEEYILNGELVDATTMGAIASKYRDFYNSKQLIESEKISDDEARIYVESHLSDAYYCTGSGKYGGQYFEKNVNYSALKAWCSLTDDRDKFVFNYDAFDVLADPTYSGEGYTYLYDSPETGAAKIYSAVKPVEYKAANTGATSLEYRYADEAETAPAHILNPGESISREDFERIKNEQLHYTRITVAAGGQDVYIVTDNFYDRGTPYAKGQDLTVNEFNSLANKSYVQTTHVSNDGAEPLVLYYCYENYDNVPSGTCITSSEYANLKNYQKNFSIQGMEPTETTTLYVSRESVFKDVISEKVISVVYQYTYYEDDDEGEGVSLTNELHVVNIHLQLESGVPQIGLLNPPATVLPGNAVGLKKPDVNPGLYEVITNGWELYSNEEDAWNHRNGVPFTNGITPAYWYQNNKAWVAFYSKTYLGKTYSNPVPLSVANYHDIDAVMKDKEHHLYIDRADVMRPSKIYIDNRACESDPTKSELDLLKDLYDLSLQTTVATTGATQGHALLDEYVKGCENLDFILHSNVEPKAYTDWTPVGNDGQCFGGTFHGDGYTISGLNNSLFGNLCGDVYNLGVRGSFTGAGIAEKGKGYVENSWVSTSSTEAKTSKPVFGSPAVESGTPRPVRIVNCYYQEEEDAANKYTNHTGNYGIPTRRGIKDFYNGTVAYNLNGFYLNRRYYDHTTLSGSTTEFSYLPTQANGSLSEEMSTIHYPALTTDNARYGDMGYVERRYGNVDFIYADGTIPESNNIRMRTITDEDGNTTVKYAPVWPDDYLFFGQMLTYGYNTDYPHEDWPSHIAKSNGRLASNDQSNRVYRAPAYFQSKTMGVAHFNPWVNLVAKSKDGTHEAYPGMTAIDFAGHNDKSYAQGLTPDGFFFPPLLNDDGLADIANHDETRNLLVYAPSAEANTKTYNVLNSHFSEPAFSDYYDRTGDRYADGKKYDRVFPVVSTIEGHLVQSTLKTDRDHFLVDKQDFNAPIAYQMGDDNRMWYQRIPGNFANRNTGWEAISIPFSAEMVTTDDKGEITHFYEGSMKGHEYWLREYAGKKSEEGNVFTGKFSYLAKGVNEKDYTNTYLWDTYYSKDTYKDKNEDKYQELYYSKEYLESLYPVSDYPYLTAGTPYIIGFPGSTYYEFDLSGEWTPANRYQNQTIASPGKQTSTFVSGAGAMVGISDNELTATAKDGYTFLPNYMSKNVEGYLLSSSGDSFDQTATVTAAVPFRPYFIAGPVTGSAKPRNAAERIVFDTADATFTFEDNDPTQGEVGGELKFYTKKHLIGVTSTLRTATDVAIVNTSGLTIASFTIQPDETVETPLPMTGVYIIRAAGGKYSKKVTVK
ncbi:MAG: hypothetical protein K6A93_11955 [Bacteroidaceae bacterium]|nr:hypothetical protein [Bacteroidaceae bacterium]